MDGNSSHELAFFEGDFILRRKASFNHWRMRRVFVRSAVLLGLLWLPLVFGLPNGCFGQNRWVSASAQLVSNSTTDGGLGEAYSIEVGAWGRVRGSLSWISWNGVRSCAVFDAWSECGTKPEFWELGVRIPVSSAEKVIPFVGGGVGLYRRTWRTTRDLSAFRYLDDPERGAHPSIAVSAGMDLVVLSPLAVRIMVIHQEVLDGDLAAIYGHRVRYTGFSLGLTLIRR